MNNDHAQLIATLTLTHTKLEQLTNDLDDAALDFRPGPEEWSTREILAHLVDDEMFVMRTRLERMAKEDHPTLTPNDEKVWHSTRNTSHDELGELLNDFAVQRAASLNVLTFLRASDWSRTGYQPEYGQLTVEKWVRHWVEHDLNHIRQIEQNIKQFQASR